MMMMMIGKNTSGTALAQTKANETKKGSGAFCSHLARKLIVDKVPRGSNGARITIKQI